MTNCKNALYCARSRLEEVGAHRGAIEDRLATLFRPAAGGFGKPPPSMGERRFSTDPLIAINAINNGSLAENRLKTGDRRHAKSAATASPSQKLDQRQGDFAKALLDPMCPIPQGLIGPDGKASARRFNVYRNNVVAGLTGTLKDAFPAVARIVGDEFFAAMARIYVTSDPPSSPIMFDYGEGFANFVGEFEPAFRPLPYLRDLAHLERAWLEAYHSLEAQALSVESLAAFSVDDLMSLRVTLHPSLRLVRSEFPVLTLWQTNIKGGVPTWVDLDASGQDVLVNRPGADVEVRLLPPGGADFIEALCEGLCALESMERALLVDQRFDLAINLTGLVEAGALIELDLVPNRSVL